MLKITGEKPIGRMPEQALVTNGDHMAERIESQPLSHDFAVQLSKFKATLLIMEVKKKTAQMFGSCGVTFTTRY